MTIKVDVRFSLDLDGEEWDEAGAKLDPEAVATEAAAHAESVVRDLYYDNGWIAEHHPDGHPAKATCHYCKTEEPQGWMGGETNEG